MSIRRKIALAVVLTILGAAAYSGYHIVYTFRQIPDAYAAWDTGTLVIEYMKSHGNRWPSSWEDLLTVMRRDSSDQIMFRGARAGDTNYASSLRSGVAINWKFDASRADRSSPITRLDRGKFPVVWQGAEPNEMIRTYLASITTNATSIR